MNNGRLDIDTICSDLEDVANTLFSLCGPPGMVTTFSERLQHTYKVDSSCIRVDDWGESS